MKKVIISIIVLLSLTVIFFYFSQPQSGDNQGVITVRVIDQDNNVVIDDEITFTEEVSLFEILQDNYDIGCANSSYIIDYTCSFKQLNSHIVLGIEDMETDWYGSYLQIFINDEASIYGVDLILVEDETIYEFRYIDLGGDDS